MSADDQDQKVDPTIELLRSAGHDSAADLIEAAAEMAARRAAQKTRDDAHAATGPPGRPLSERPGVRLVDDSVFDARGEQDGRVIFEALKASGVGRGHGSTPLFPGLNGGER